LSPTLREALRVLFENSYGEQQSLMGETPKTALLHRYRVYIPLIFLISF
jgi:hypothetical protein